MGLFKSKPTMDWFDIKATVTWYDSRVDVYQPLGAEALSAEEAMKIVERNIRENYPNAVQSIKTEIITET